MVKSPCCIIVCRGIDGRVTWFVCLRKFVPKLRVLSFGGSVVKRSCCDELGNKCCVGVYFGGTKIG